MKKIAFSILVLGALASSQVMAQAYVAAGVGSGHSELDCAGTTSCNNNGTSFRVLGGYKFNDTFAAELGYLSFGEAKASVSGVDLKLTPKAVTLGVAARFPFATDWGFTARLGVANVKTDVSGVVAGLGNANLSDSKVAAHSGLGLDYALSSSLKLELTADFSRATFRDGDFSVRAVNLGLSYHF
ncbi:OOP family OmpA-OmpF porin [Paucibacter oligotrophus]|uniref:OOP family OmpA-OmpF porin n=1 Tax=Roseateles oligotrophus TaxID=1769250 RepID=A0A840LAS9_9BURK|nr:outer membrane beta-barrel protein [Roseateles oligotrophus]MBB4845280.1 OOP family OmpA-OmpF porin [Roseateles oligotrophus]